MMGEKSEYQKHLESLSETEYKRLTEGNWSSKEQEPPTDMDIWNDLQRQNDQLKAENERLKVALQRIIKIGRYDHLLWTEQIKMMKGLAEQALNEVTK